MLDGGAPIYSAFRRANVPFRDASGALTERAASALRDAGIDPAAVTPEIEAAFAAKGPSAAVAREAAASEFAIPLSTGQAMLDPVALRLKGAAFSGGRRPWARDIGQEFSEREAGAIDAARGRLNTMAARGGPVIDNPASASEAVADRAQAIGRGYAEDVASAETARGEALAAVRGPGAPTYSTGQPRPSRACVTRPDGHARPMAVHTMQSMRLRAPSHRKPSPARGSGSVPEWLQNVARGGFDPNRIASSLFGSGVPGARPGALNEAKALLGEDPAEWSMLRQAAVQRLTGDLSANARKAVEAVRAFTDGLGSGVARELFSGAELGQLRRFAAAVNSTSRPVGSAKADMSAAAGAAAKALDVLAGMVAFKAGGPAAAGAAYSVKPGSRLIVGGLGARSARRSFEGGTPRERLPVPYLPNRPIGLTRGLHAGSGQ